MPQVGEVAVVVVAAGRGLNAAAQVKAEVHRQVVETTEGRIAKKDDEREEAIIVRTEGGELTQADTSGAEDEDETQALARAKTTANRTLPTTTMMMTKVTTCHPENQH
mmetsp:Transcript_57787/g.126643  ORF Transcript_57787/g.126643 Transcript_57787/m.126643 type:complete len:108 (+) Transcript_57787:101-424(+)